MSEQTAFLKSIAATPDDDTSRLAYADWLTEHGNPNHAALIRGQCGQQPLGKRPVRMIGAAMGACREVMRWRDQWGAVVTSCRWTAVTRKNLDVIVKPAHHTKKYDRYGVYQGPESYNWALFRRGFVSFIHCPHAVWEKHRDAIRHDHPGVVWTSNTLLQYADMTYLRLGQHLPTG